MRPLSKQFLRENFLGLSLTLVGILCLVLSTMVYLGHRSAPPFALAQDPPLNGPDIEVLERQNRAYERIAQVVTPAVVNIRTTQVIKVQQSPFFNDPFFRQFFGDMFGGIPRQQREHALGSGVIVSTDGYIVTNNHVVRGATDIEVLLHDKRTLKGKVVGADPQTDVAVIKVAANNLPTVPWGDSSTLRVGDTVMAFGNPFGLNFTVTRGSVSALGRSGLGLGDVQFEDFIQTDAAINHGNSGGPLINVRGQVVGINTVILSTNAGPQGEGGWMGIGFAIPSSLAQHVMESLVNSGKVTRGYLGISVSSLDQGMAKEFKVPDTSGALVQDVSPGTPADKAGLKEGDVIRALNGKIIESSNQLTSLVASSSPGTVVNLDILRDGKPMTVRVTLGERPANLSVRAPGRAPSEGPLRGISVQNLTPDLREQLDTPSSVHGVVITEIDPNSPAAEAGLQPGDVIESINRHAVNSLADFNRLANQARGDTLLRVNRGGTGLFVRISPGGEGN